MIDSLLLNKTFIHFNVGVARAATGDESCRAPTSQSSQCLWQHNTLNSGDVITLSATLHHWAQKPVANAKPVDMHLDAPSKTLCWQSGPQPELCIVASHTGNRLEEKPMKKPSIK